MIINIKYCLIKNTHNRRWTVNKGKILDDVGVKILNAIQEDAKISYSDLGRLVNLSSPAVAARVHDLEKSGYIRQYRAYVDGEKIGFPCSAFVKVTPDTADKDSKTHIDELVREIPEITEAHYLTGLDESDGIIFKIVFSSVNHLESIIRAISPLGETATFITLSSWSSSRPLPIRR
jgi:Lrp/AsnC family leucine-responsive transcriptional regulator